MKTFLTIALSAVTLGLSAQNANVVSAYNYMNDGKLAKAVEFIEPAILDAKTGATEKAWRYRGNIYRLIAIGEDEALKTQFPDALERSVDSYLKANELDTKGSYKVENVQALGALHGVPIAVKDLCDVTGERTIAGMPRIRADSAPAANDASVVRRLREAGAVLLGKLQLTEGAVAHRREGDLTRPRRASQLRDSAGFTPDFASHTAPGKTPDAGG